MNRTIGPTQQQTTPTLMRKVTETMKMREITRTKTTISYLLNGMTTIIQV